MRLILALLKDIRRLQRRNTDDRTTDGAQSTADDLEEEEDGAEEESSPVGDNSSPSQASQAAQDAQYSMPGGKKAIAILEQERIQAAGKGMKGSKIITSAGLKAPVMA